MAFGECRIDAHVRRSPGRDGVVLGSERQGRAGHRQHRQQVGAHAGGFAHAVAPQKMRLGNHRWNSLLLLALA